MAPVALSALVALLSASLTVAQNTAPSFPPTALIDLVFPRPTDAPEKVFPGQFARGTQSGYNICNSTTEGPSSMCQTSHMGGIDDFCFWAPQTPDSTIADTEGEEVAWCTKAGHGSRIVPAGAIKSAQLLKTSEYWMITGTIDQTLLNIQSGDFGGELDSGGQDLLGNPIGGLFYSTAFNTSEYQVRHWTSFIGNNQFCVKICNDQGTNPTGYCQHTLDRIGLGYNCPSKYTVSGATDTEFAVCDSDLMTVPGVYVENGQTLSYSQPAESLGAITTIPYQPSTVASSNCVTTASAALYTDAGSAPVGSATPSVTASVSGSVTISVTASAKASASASGSKAASASASASAGASNNNGAGVLGVSLGAGIVGVAFSIAFLA